MIALRRICFPALDHSEMACGEAVEVRMSLDNDCLAQPQEVLEGFPGDRRMVVHVQCRLAIKIRSRGRRVT